MTKRQSALSANFRLRGNVARVLALVVAIPLAGCGVTYNSPRVIDGDPEAPVDVVSLTRAEVLRANRTPYEPRSIPSAFFLNAQSRAVANRAGQLPELPFVPEERLEPIEFRPLPAVSPPIYRIGVGDVLLISTPGGSASTVEQLSGLLAAQSQRQGYTVRDDGTIAIPEIGTISLVDLTLQEAEDQIFDTLVTNQIDPTFTLEVAEFNSRKASIGGAVGQTSQLSLGLNPMSLRDAITLAGGITAPETIFASIRVFRDGSIYQIPVDRYLEEPSLGEAAVLDGDAIFVDTGYDLGRAQRFYQSQLDVIARREGTRSAALAAVDEEIDVLTKIQDRERALFNDRQNLGVEERDFVYLAGELEQSRFPLPYQLDITLADVLFEKGGFNVNTADPSEIYVMRDGAFEGRPDRIIAYHLDGSNAARLSLATQFEMRPRDVIFIEEQPITKWNRSLQQFFPFLIRRVDQAL